MPIRFHCSKCGNSYEVKDDLGGRTAKCRCGHTMVIPSASSIGASFPSHANAKTHVPRGGESHQGSSQSPAAAPQTVPPAQVEHGSSSAYPQQNSGKRRWYDDKPIVVLLLIVFFPVGLYALWKNSQYSTNTKVWVTVIVAFLVFVVAGVPPAAESPETSQKSERIIPESSNSVELGGAPSTSITWEEYIRDCGDQAQEANPVRAKSVFEQKYKNKIVKWRGAVKSIKEAWLGGFNIAITMTPTEFPNSGEDIILHVPESVDIMALSSGNTISFTARITTQGGGWSSHEMDWVGQ